jgi:PRTRC genetic system protein C
MATVQTITRQFSIKVNGNYIVLEDPNPELSADEVKDILSNHYPQLLNAKIEKKGIDDNGVESYEFLTIAGTKG